MPHDKPKKEANFRRACGFPHSGPFLIRFKVRELGIPNYIVGMFSIKMKTFGQGAERDVMTKNFMFGQEAIFCLLIAIINQGLVSINSSMLANFIP